MNEIRSDCRDVRERLASHAIGALAPEESAAVVSHLARCVACAGELAALDAVRSELDRWAEPSDAAEPRALALAAFEHARRGRRHVRRALVVAAAVALVAALFALGGARARFTRGAFELALGRDLEREQSTRIESAAVARAGEQNALGLAELERRHAAQLRQIEAAWAREREALLAALEHARAADRELVAAELAHLARGAAEDTRETRAALVDLAAYVARREAP